MKWLLLLGVVGCSSPDPFEARVLPFGPFEVGPGEEVTTQCVQITLHNEQDLFINSIDLATGPGFHHSNWFYIPENTFRGEDGTYTCTDRDFSEPVAALFGGVLFAQSTQHERELQHFPEGVVIRVPARSKLVSQIHLLNSSEEVQHLEPSITLTPIPDASVTTTLSAISFQNHALALPPNMQSKFTVECDLGAQHEAMLGVPPDFKIYYGLGHYHELGTGLAIEAIAANGDSTPVFSTENRVGDAMGGPIDPAFEMTGFSKLRFSCEYFNPRASTVRWGNGDQEMCVFLAFSDSPLNWGGGVNTDQEPENPIQVGNQMQFTNSCTVFASPATR